MEASCLSLVPPVVDATSSTSILPHLAISSQAQNPVEKPPSNNIDQPEDDMNYDLLMDQNLHKTALKSDEYFSEMSNLLHAAVVQKIHNRKYKVNHETFMRVFLKTRNQTRLDMMQLIKQIGNNRQFSFSQLNCTDMNRISTVYNVRRNMWKIILIKRNHKVPDEYVGASGHVLRHIQCEKHEHDSMMVEAEQYQQRFSTIFLGAIFYLCQDLVPACFAGAVDNSNQANVKSIVDRIISCGTILEAERIVGDFVPQRTWFELKNYHQTISVRELGETVFWIRHLDWHKGLIESKSPLPKNCEILVAERPIQALIGKSCLCLLTFFCLWGSCYNHPDDQTIRRQSSLLHTYCSSFDRKRAFYDNPKQQNMRDMGLDSFNLTMMAVPLSLENKGPFTSEPRYIPEIIKWLSANIFDRSSFVADGCVDIDKWTYLCLPKISCDSKAVLQLKNFSHRLHFLQRFYDEVGISINHLFIYI